MRNILYFLVIVCFTLSCTIQNKKGSSVSSVEQNGDIIDKGYYLLIDSSIFNTLKCGKAILYSNEDKYVNVDIVDVFGFCVYEKVFNGDREAEKFVASYFEQKEYLSNSYRRNIHLLRGGEIFKSLLKLAHNFNCSSNGEDFYDPYGAVAFYGMIAMIKSIDNESVEDYFKKTFEYYDDQDFKKYKRDSGCNQTYTIRPKVAAIDDALKQGLIKLKKVGEF